MKNYLHTLPYFLLFFILAYSPTESYSQCTCSGGAPATPLTYYSKLDTTDVPVSMISFPKFDPSTGILACVTLRDTTSLISVSGVRNTASSDVTYEFLLNVNNRITGPGISINQNASRNYGPSLLTAYGTVNDSTSYGPDTLFQNAIHQNSSSSVSSYLGGSGNIDFEYKVNGGGIATDGGLNYRYQIHSKYWGGFRLTYYWCPNILLASNIRDFAALKKDKAVLLTWLIENKASGTTYEIESSHDGSSFTVVGKSDPAAIAGSTTNHEFQYDPGATTSLKLYFRIKQKDASGKITYSAIRTVMMNEDSPAGFMVYPNPVSRKVSMQFDRSLNGNYTIEVTSLAGQIIYNRNVRLHNNSNLQFELTNLPPSGIYYLKMTDIKSNRSYSHKLIVKR